MKTKLIIFGISGDLSRRKLLPALSSIIATGDFNDLEIIGVSRKALNPAGLFDAVLLEKSTVFSMDMALLADYRKLKSSVDIGQDSQILIYLSVPPVAAHQIIELLGEAGLNGSNVKLLLEKPFGVDYDSAVQMNQRLSTFFDEQQLYRIDHYLAKEMAQNIVAFRAGNALFSHMWSGEFIEKIEIEASETIGVEGRAQFYEQTGALRDVVQGHLMQLLSLVLMDIPTDLDWNELPVLRQSALQAVAPANPKLVKRAQYQGYQEEVGNLGSLTETFVYFELSSDSLRWKNVPLILLAGKALAKKTTEIRIHFKKLHEAQGNVLTFRIQPNEGIEMELFIKKPGYERGMESQKLRFSYPDDTVLPDAYEQVLVDAIRSQKSLFASSGEVLESWRILQPLLSAWEMEGGPLEIYS